MASFFVFALFVKAVPALFSLATLKWLFILIVPCAAGGGFSLSYPCDREI